MARTTEAEVNEIMDMSLTDPQILPFINLANRMVTSVLGGSGLSDELLEDIERYLSAHLIATTKARMGEKEQIGEATVVYIGKFGMGFQSTPYGQMVLLLDTTGKFAVSGKKAINIKAITSFE